jgi:3',5'-cyclic AMP phosphodiesterase CpdA
MVRAPYVQNVGRNRASILWATTEIGEGSVTVGGPEGAYTVAASARTFDSFVQYQADLGGLQPSTAYAYRVKLNGLTLTPSASSFRTAGPGRFSFLAFGDSGADTPEQRAIVNLMAAERDIALAVHTGDLAYPEASHALLDANYFAINSALMSRIPFYPTPGNHEYYSDSGGPYFASHAFPESNAVTAADRGRYYSFDWGEAHLVSLDSNLMLTEAADRMLAWLDRDLATSRQYWKIVFLHHTPYPSGHHLGDQTSAAVRASVNPIAEKHGVQLFLAGHEHAYERTVPIGGTTYVTTGGGGAWLQHVSMIAENVVAASVYNYVRVDLDGAALTLRAIGIDGAEIDRFTLRPGPAIAVRGVVSIGDYTNAVAPGSLVSIFGRNLARAAKASDTLPLPTELGGVRVKLGDHDAPLLFVSPSQVNVQIPFEAGGNVTVGVINENGGDEREISLTPTAPSIITVEGNVTIYATGLGRCAQPLPTGAPVAALTSPLERVEVVLGDARIEPTYAGAAPGMVGVYRINYTIPADTPPGTHPLRITAGGASSRSVPIEVK